VLVGVLGACHSVSGREHPAPAGTGAAGEGGKETDTDGSAGGLGGESDSAAGASGGHAVVGQAGAMAGAGGALAGAGGALAGAGGALAGAGGALAGAGGAPVVVASPAGSGGTSTGGNQTPTGGSQIDEPTCEEGSPCVPDARCWLGLTSCDHGIQTCVASEPTPEHEACGSGQECTGDGTCVKVSPSCVDQPIAGCGTLTVMGGSFKMGWSKANAEVSWQPVTVDTFVVDTYEVTVARFRRFWQAGHPVPSPITYPGGRSVDATYRADEPEATTENAAYNWSSQEGLRESYPINRVSWEAAFAFCAWDGGRLPTEAEWEYVASGRKVEGLEPGRLYVWGDAEPTCALTHGFACSPATALGADALSPIGGVFEMAGNISEWTVDTYESYGGSCWDGTARVNPLCWNPDSQDHTARGSSFLSSIHPSIWRAGHFGRTASRGIRCVRDPVE
jgi:sulfatase modifying factor 1